MTSDIPDQIDMPPPKWRLGLVGALLIASGVAIGLAADLTHIWPMLFIAVIDVLLGVFFLSGIFRGVGLSLDRDGFTVRGMFGDRRRNWGDVSAFHVGRAGKARAIRFDDVTKTGVFADANTAVGRGNSRISPLVISGGMDATCALLNAFRTRAVGPRA